MKKIFSFLAAFAALALTACDKDVDPATTPEPQPSAPGAKVEIYFTSPKTRAFGSGTTEAWEKTVNNATVLVFNASGAIKFRRALSSAEIASAATTPISLVIPGVSVGDKCDFAVVANRTVPTSVTTKTLLLAEEENDAASYNGTFAEVTTKAMRPAGFVMTGITNQAIVEGTTNVSVTLKRAVAKIEVTTATTADFTTKYGPATITVNKVTLSRGSLKSMLIDQTTSKYATGGATFSHIQNASAGNNLFYIYEKAAAAEGSRVLLKIDATYDADGVSSTTADQVPLVYEVELTGTAGGQIARNGAYRVNAKIDGLTGNDVSLTVTIANWETLKTQDIILGN